MNLSKEGLEGTVMIIGASDTGKSTLARHLYQELCRNGCPAAYLDTDMGQSILGLPTTLNLALSGEPGDDRFPPRGKQTAFFVGSLTPRGHMLPTVIGAHRLQQKALRAGAEAVVVDTTGLVERSQGGKALKQWKIELLAPSTVIGLQRAGELEPILWPLRRDRRVRCMELRVSPRAMERSRQARIDRRRARLARYLQPAQPRLIAIRQMAVYNLELLAKDAILAFQDQDGFALGLGVVDEVDRPGSTMVARTPLPDLEGVASIRLGEARWDPDQTAYR
jgi:polynucleotide 5'-hydroxyl-kinase GRC3/NOL9